MTTGKPIELIPRPNPSTQTVAIPLHSSGASQKAQVFRVVDEKGNVVLSIDASTRAITMAGAAGALVLPSITLAERDALTPTAGMTIYNTSDNVVEFYNGSSWRAVAVV